MDLTIPATLAASAVLALRAQLVFPGLLLLGLVHPVAQSADVMRADDPDVITAGLPPDRHPLGAPLHLLDVPPVAELAEQPCQACLTRHMRAYWCAMISHSRTHPPVRVRPGAVIADRTRCVLTTSP